MTPPAGTANSTLPLNITRGNTPMTPPAGTANSTLPLNITRGNTPPSSDESPSPPSSETPPSPPSSSNSSNLVVGITVGTAVVLVFICGIIMLFRKRSPQRSKRSKVTVGPYDAHPPNDHVVSIPLPHAPIPSGSTSHVASPLAFSSRNSKFTYEELQRATGGFSDANRLGEGGFGPVHKGTLRNGKEVAVKQLKAGSGQGERRR